MDMGRRGPPMNQDINSTSVNWSTCCKKRRTGCYKFPGRPSLQQGPNYKRISAQADAPAQVLRNLLTMAIFASTKSACLTSLCVSQWECQFG